MSQPARTTIISIAIMWNGTSTFPVRLRDGADGESGIAGDATEGPADADDTVDGFPGADVGRGPVDVKDASKGAAHADDGKKKELSTPTTPAKSPSESVSPKAAD